MSVNTGQIQYSALRIEHNDTVDKSSGDTASQRERRGGHKEHSSLGPLAASLVPFSSLLTVLSVV
jgi:hypothetical protein